MWTRTLPEEWKYCCVIVIALLGTNRTRRGRDYCKVELYCDCLRYYLRGTRRGRLLRGTFARSARVTAARMLLNHFFLFFFNTAVLYRHRHTFIFIYLFFSSSRRLPYHIYQSSSHSLAIVLDSRIYIYIGIPTWIQCWRICIHTQW